MKVKSEYKKPSVLRRVLACLVSAAMVVAFTPVVAWGEETAVTVGDLTISATNEGDSLTAKDYTYFNNSKTLTITSGKAIIISNKPSVSTAKDHIVVASGVTANITLSGVDIRFDNGTPDKGIPGTCAFEIAAGATVNLTLVGANTLQSGIFVAGLQVPSGSSLTITGDGSLTAISRGSGAGIGGGGFENNRDSGSITINGGTVKAATEAGFGAGIGGGGDITITGGEVTATGNAGYPGIGGNSGIGGTLIHIGGTVNAIDNAVAGIKPENTDNNKLISFGDLTLPVDLTIISDKTLTIPADASLTIPAGKTLTNEGTITISDTGKLTNNGTVYVDGTLSGTFDKSSSGAVYYPLTLNGNGGTINVTGDKSNKPGDTTITYGKAEGTVTLTPVANTGYKLQELKATVGNQAIDLSPNEHDGYGFTMPNAAVTVAAKFSPYSYNIAYVLDDGTINSGNVTSYTYGVGATLPTDVTKTGYTFGGWYDNANCTGTVVTAISTTETGEKTFYAKWTIKQYTVTFDANGHGTAPAAITNVEYSTSIPAPNPPEVEGYTFGGWYKDSDCTEAWDFANDKVVGNTTLYAKWTVNSYDVVFVTNGGSAIEPVKEKYGDKVTKPADPTREGYTFAGWYSDSELTTAWNFESSTMPADNITLYAKWLSQDTTVQKVTVKSVDATVDNANRTVEVTLPYNVALPTQSSDFEITPAVGAEVTTQPVKEGDVWKFTVIAEDSKTKATYTISVNVQKENVRKETVLRLQSTASKTSIKLKWNAVPEADGYVIYWNKCGTKNGFKQVKVIENGKTLTWTHKNLKKGSWNRYYVKAYKVIDGKKSFIKTSNKIHLVTKGGKYTNVKNLKSSASKVTLKKGKTKALKITQVYAEKNKKPTLHMRALTYTTSDKTVATVTSKGVIKAKGKGTCYIYITAYSGVYTRVKVTVK